MCMLSEAISHESQGCLAYSSVKKKLLTIGICIMCLCNYWLIFSMQSLQDGLLPHPASAIRIVYKTKLTH
jgi:hypothetical protein